MRQPRYLLEWHFLNVCFVTECTYNGQTFRHNKTWKPYDNRDPCFECICINGEFQCYTLTCETITCANGVAPISDLGECCPKCPREYWLITLRNFRSLTPTSGPVQPLPLSHCCLSSDCLWWKSSVLAESVEHLPGLTLWGCGMLGPELEPQQCLYASM